MPPEHHLPSDGALRLRGLWDSAEQIAQTGSWERIPSESNMRWSDNLYRIFGFEPGEVQPSTGLVLAMAVPADRDRLVRAFRDFERGGDLRLLDYRIVRTDGVRRHLRTTLSVTERRDDRAHRLVGVVQDLTDTRSAEREIAAHVAVEEALVEWDALESGGRRLLAGLAAALDCTAGVFWTPLAEVLIARVSWDEDGADATAVADAGPPVQLARGVGVAGRAWEAGRPRGWTLAAAEGPDSPRADCAGDPLIGRLAVPAVDGEEVLAVVELRSDHEVRISERLMRSLHGIAHELGHFLSRRRGELAAPLVTPREVEVLQLGAEGLTARMTAERLSVSTATIRTHLENIYQKLDVSDKASAVATALRLGIID